MGDDYPVSPSFKVLEGYDVYKSVNLWIALLAVDSDRGKDIRLYRWQKRTKEKKTEEGKEESEDVWKVDLCRMSVRQWDWPMLSNKVNEFRSKYGIK
jgi:hypothetical protein